MQDTWELLISCEHASNRVPREIRGQHPADLLSTHVAWDPCSEEIAQRLGDRLGTGPIIAEWSRLVVDLNRSPDNPEVVPENAFGEDIAWNQGLSTLARSSRIRRYHQPYWNIASERVADCHERGARIVHLGIHSFTPVYRGITRGVDIGLLFDPARAYETKFAEILRRHLEPSGLTVRYNEPYDGRSDGIGQAFRSRYPADSYVHIELEVNQRLCADILAIVDSLVVAILALPILSACGSASQPGASREKDALPSRLATRPRQQDQ